ncbi:MAG: hypothetical protein WKG06_06355 [Segetibacter sp.]
MEKVLELIGTSTLKDSYTIRCPKEVLCITGMLAEQWPGSRL